MGTMFKSFGPERDAQFNSDKGREYALNELINQLIYLYSMSNRMDREEILSRNLKL